MLDGTKTKVKVRDLLDQHYDSKVVAPMNTRLDEIETFVKEEIAKVVKQNKAIQGFLMQEVKYTIANQLYNAEITMAAWEKVLLSEGLKIENLQEKIDAAKATIQAENQAKAEEKLKETASGESKSNEQA